jgi:hypothetical protein
MQYVRRLVAQAAPGIKIVLSTFPSSRDHAAFEQVLVVGNDRLEVKWIAGEEKFKTSIAGKDGLSLHPAYWRLFRKHWRCLKASSKAQVIVPYLDYCSYAIGVLGSPFGRNRFSGIVMRPDFHWKEMGVKAPPSKLGWLKKSLILRLLKNSYLHRLVTIDPSLNDWARRHKPTGLEKLVYVVDPSDLRGESTRSDARNRLGVPEDACVLLLFGAVDLRKGLVNFLNLLAHADTPANVIGLVIGKESDAAIAAILTANLPTGRLVVYNRYVNAEEEWQAFLAADWVWTAYEGFYGPSGVLAQASQMNLRVIHNGLGLIGYTLASSSRRFVNEKFPDLFLSTTPQKAPGTAMFGDLVAIILEK